MGNARSRAMSIPYYQLRDAIEQGYGRRRMLYHSVIYGLVAGVLGGIWNYFSTQTPNLFVAVSVAVVLALAVPILIFLAQLLGDALSISMKEEELVSLCLERLETWRDEPVTRSAIREMADRASDGIQVRSPVGLIVLTIVSSIAIATQLPVLTAVFMSELALLAVISVVVVVGQGQADIVIRNALIEFERRLVVGEMANVQETTPATSSTPFPLPTSEAAQPMSPLPLSVPAPPASQAVASPTTNPAT